MIHPITFAIAAALTLLSTTAASTESPGDEPEVQSYALDYEVKVLSDRRTNGLSDTFLKPGAEFTVNAAHESGLIGFLQVGTVAKESFPEGNRLTAVTAIGYRWGAPSGWHFGIGLAKEWFPGAKVDDAPTRPFVDLGASTNTRFDTSFGVFEFGYGAIEARYLHVLSKDFRGNNSAVVCGSRFGNELLGMLLGQADASEAIACYGDGLKHSRGSQLLSVDTKYGLRHDTRLTAHIGYTKVKNFSQVTTIDYKLGIVHTRWGLDFGLDLIAAQMKDRSYAITYDAEGNAKRIDKTALIASMAKRF